MAAGIGGLVATLPMTAAMVLLHKALPSSQQQFLPPRQIVENVAEAGIPLGDSEEAHQGTALAAHFTYGAAAGAGYAMLAGKSGLHPALEGTLYGLAIWGGSYLGLMPATGLYKSATEEPAERNLLMIAAHVVWGASLGIAVDMLTTDRGE